MPSYYEALPIYKAAHKRKVVASPVAGSPSNAWNVKRRRLACIFERPLARECEQEKSK
jgi:hypothetical protein